MNGPIPWKTDGRGAWWSVAGRIAPVACNCLRPQNEPRAHADHCPVFREWFMAEGVLAAITTRSPATVLSPARIGRQAGLDLCACCGDPRPCERVRRRTFLGNQREVAACLDCAPKGDVDANRIAELAATWGSATVLFTAFRRRSDVETVTV